MDKKVEEKNEVKFEIFKTLISSGNFGPYLEQYSISSAIEITNTTYDKLCLAGIIEDPEKDQNQDQSN